MHHSSQQVLLTEGNQGKSGSGRRTLREWQKAAHAATLERLKTDRSTLVVAATGTGKTRLGVELIKSIGGRCLWLAPRHELLTQARDAIQSETDLTVGMEQAGNDAYDENIVVGSVATLHKDKRLHRYGPGDFALVVCDEAHFSVSRTYRKIVDYFTGAKVVGITATPDRLDKIGLHNLFQSVAYVYDIQDAITDGVLCRIRAESVCVEAIDLTGVGTSAGDLKQDELDAVMRAREVLHGVVRPTLDKAGNRPTFVFTSSVDTANATVEVFNAYRPGCANAAFGSTDYNVRGELLDSHRKRDFQFFVSVGIHSFGVDAPWVSCVVLARPSKSRTYVAQSIGRGTRAGKPDLLVLDFVGNAGRHKLITPADILGGRLPPELVVKVKEKLKSGESDVMGLLDQEERAERERVKLELQAKADDERAMLARAKATVRYEVTTADLFGHFKLDTASILLQSNEVIQPGQVERLRKYKIPIPADMTRAGAAAVIKKEAGRRFYGYATYSQVLLLARYGVDGAGVRMRDVTKVLEAAKNERKAA